MKKIELHELDASYYYEKLPNSLECFLIPFSNRNNYFITYATRFGSIQTEFVPKNSKKMKKFPDGIAHFLEHKMFEQEDGVDPFTYYAKSGTGANASTSFDNTQYICYGTDKIKENLDFLLNYVNSPYFTDENVEKEKGIIAEEIKMYDDIPEWTLEEELKKNVYNEHPIRIDIAGTVSEIDKITKEDLYECYNTYYRPDNMFLIVAGNFDVEEIMTTIQNNNFMKLKREKYNVKEKQYNEKNIVNKQKKELYMDVVVPKLGFALKLNRQDFVILDDYLLDSYFQMFATVLFGNSSKFREDARMAQLFNDYYIEKERAGNYITLYLLAETDKPQEFLDFIEKQLHNIEFLEEDVERIKKVWLANEVRIIDNVDSTVSNLYYEILKYKKVIVNKVELIKKLNVETLRKMFKNITLDKKMTSVIIWPKDRKES